MKGSDLEDSVKWAARSLAMNTSNAHKPLNELELAEIATESELEIGSSSDLKLRRQVKIWQEK